MSEMTQAQASLVHGSVMRFSGVHLGAVGAATSYLADGGALATSLLLTAAQNFPMPGPVTLKNLRAKCNSNPLIANLVVEVYKNGSTTGLKVTIAAADTSVNTDSTHTVSIAAGDTIDLRADSTGAGVTTATIVASVEVT